jgi:hypothetical protein
MYYPNAHIPHIRMFIKQFPSYALYISNCLLNQLHKADYLMQYLKTNDLQFDLNGVLNYEVTLSMVV